MEPEGSLSLLDPILSHIIRPSPRPCVKFYAMRRCSTLKLEDYPLTDVAVQYSVAVSSVHNTRTHHVMVTRCQLDIELQVLATSVSLL